MKIKILAILLAALLLGAFIAGCNGSDDVGDDSILDEPQNGSPTNSAEADGDADVPSVPNDSNDLPNDPEPVEVVIPEQAIEVLEQFRQLALEMDAGDHTTTRERLVEVFGTPRLEDGNLLDFEVAPDFGVMALLSDGRVIVISISPIPDFFIDENLDPDYERLISYMHDTDGLTLDYFVELFGTPGFLITYSNGIFSYTWRSSAFSFWVDVRGDNEVESVFFEDNFDIGMDEVFEQRLLVLPDEVLQAIHDLAGAMQRNNGRITADRAKDIMGIDYNVSEQFVIFPIVDGVDFAIIVEDTGMVEHIFMSPTMNIYLAESLPIGTQDLLDLAEEARTQSMTLEEFEDSIGSPGTLWHYTFNEFTFIWITPDTSVIARVNQNNEISDATVSHFVG